MQAEHLGGSIVAGGTGFLWPPAASPGALRALDEGSHGRVVGRDRS